MFLFAFGVMDSLQAQSKENPCEGETQLEMNLCAAENYKKADAELNKTWKLLIANLLDEEVEELREVQRLWLRFRDAHCDYEAARYEGGSIQPLIRYTCLQTLTETRTEQLKDRLKEVH